MLQNCIMDYKTSCTVTSNLKCWFVKNSNNPIQNFNSIVVKKQKTNS